MEKQEYFLKGQNVLLRLIQKDDKESYYNAGFSKVDQESAYYTQSDSSFTEEQISAYIDKIVDNDSRYDFLIIDSTGNICGESVLNNINWQNRTAHFRIALFDHKTFGKGLGSESLDLTMKFGFDFLALKRIELEVFGFNERAIRAYSKAGFIVDEVEENVTLLDGRMSSILKMSLTKQPLQQ